MPLCWRNGPVVLFPLKGRDNKETGEEEKETGEVSPWDPLFSLPPPYNSENTPAENSQNGGALSNPLEGGGGS